MTEQPEFFGRGLDGTTSANTTTADGGTRQGAAAPSTTATQRSEAIKMEPEEIEFDEYAEIVQLDNKTLVMGADHQEDVCEGEPAETANDHQTTLMKTKDINPMEQTAMNQFDTASNVVSPIEEEEESNVDIEETVTKQLLSPVIQH